MKNSETRAAISLVFLFYNIDMSVDAPIHTYALAAIFCRNKIFSKKRKKLKKV